MSIPVVAGPTALKRALIDALAASGALGEVQLAYSWPGNRAERECVYTGQARYEQKFAAMNAGRHARDRRLVVELHIEVVSPGGTVEELDARVEELAEAIDGVLASNVTLGAAVPGLRYGGVVAGEFDSAVDDESAMSAAVLQVSFSARIQ